MTAPTSGQDQDLTSTRGAALRQQLADLAGSIAWTEEWVADTLDRLAQTRPRDAEKLRLRAAQSRAYAQEERRRADKWGCPSLSQPAR